MHPSFLHVDAGFEIARFHQRLHPISEYEPFTKEPFNVNIRR